MVDDVVDWNKKNIGKLQYIYKAGYYDILKKSFYFLIHYDIIM